MFEYEKLGKMLIENKRENVKEMLSGVQNIRLFYLVVLSFVFHDYRTFELRNDLIVNDANFDGDIIVCDDGNIIYFKNQENELTNMEFESILNICYKLQDKCGGNVEAYLFCSPEIEFRGYSGIEREGVSIKLASLKSFNGDEAVKFLDYKRKNNKRFNFADQVYHLLLPYMNCVDKEEYISKVQHYLFETMMDNVKFSE